MRRAIHIQRDNEKLHCGIPTLHIYYNLRPVSLAINIRNAAVLSTTQKHALGYTTSLQTQTNRTQRGEKILRDAGEDVEGSYIIRRKEKQEFWVQPRLSSRMHPTQTFFETERTLCFQRKETPEEQNQLVTPGVQKRNHYSGIPVVLLS